MKNILVLVLLVVGGVLIFSCDKTDSPSRALVYERYVTFTLDADSMLIENDDNVLSATINVPSWATDSCDVIGAEGVQIDGHTSSLLTIAPGETMNIGTGSNTIYYLHIMPEDVVRIILLQRRNR